MGEEKTAPLGVAAAADSVPELKGPIKCDFCDAKATRVSIFWGPGGLRPVVMCDNHVGESTKPQDLSKLSPHPVQWKGA